MRLFWICLGGAAGSGTRFLVAGWVTGLFGAEFPYGTLVVNVLGSFLLGVVMHVGLTTDLLAPTLRLALATGFLGGFTTYSTFNYETLQYVEQGVWERALTNVLATLSLCGLGGIAGAAAARSIFGT